MGSRPTVDQKSLKNLCCNSGSRSAARASPAPGVKPRAPSPLSPTKISRTEEKRTLGNLNDRLAAYIERVRTLELENNRLEQQVTTIEETNSKEIISVRHMYDKELNQVTIVQSNL